MKRLFFVVLISAISMHSHAWQSTISESYQLGDGDSRITARKHAREALRTKAAAQAKSYIQTTTSLENDNITESVEVITASLVEITEYKETLVKDGTRNGSLEVTALVKVDDSTLGQRVKALQQDSDTRAKIALLFAENKKLRTLISRPSSSKSGNELRELSRAIEVQDERYKALEQNLKSVNSIFEQGTLFQMAARSDDLLVDAKKDITSNVLELLGKTQINVSVEGTKTKGEKLEVLVNVDWKAPIAQVGRVLQKYLTLKAEPGYIMVHNTTGPGWTTPRSDTEDIYDWLSSQQVMIEVSISGEFVELPLLYTGKAFFMSESCSVNPDAIGRRAKAAGPKSKICIVDPSSRGYRGTKRLTNPVSILISREQAKSATAVQARVVLKDI